MSDVAQIDRSIVKPTPRAPAAPVVHVVTARRKNERNLILLYRRRSMAHQRVDFERIAEIIRRRAPDIHPIVLCNRWYNALLPRWLLRPSLVFSPVGGRRFWMPNAAIFQGKGLSKSDELERLERIGIPVPRWRLISRTATPDLSDFGPYVVTKPNVGSRGAEVKIKRATRVRWKQPVNENALRAKDDRLLAQEFIYTGPWPVSYRVTTLFGRPLFSWRVEASRQRRPLAGPDKFREGGEHGGGLSICSSGEGCRFTLNDEQDVIDLGEAAHRAFPDVPLLGFDIVREQPSGKLFVIEANSCGRVWHFSSITGRSIQDDNQIDFESQFSGIDRAADVLIEAARKYAA